MCPRFARSPAPFDHRSLPTRVGRLLVLLWLASPQLGRAQSPAPAPTSAHAPTAPQGSAASPGADGTQDPSARPAADARTPPGPTTVEASAPPSAAPSGPDRPLPAQLPLRELTEQGIRQFQQGEYDAAIESFSAAHVLSPNPMFLFNIAQAHRKASRPREALLHYQLFLRKAPDSPLRPETEAYIALVETQLQSRQQAAQRVQSPVQHAAPSSPPVSPQESPARPLYKRAGFYGVLLGSAAAVGLGVGLGVYFATRPPATSLGIVDPVF